jgi:CheY-like chemotaxis protein
VPLVTRADASMLDQVLMNLVVNARDAMPDGGTLVLATSERVVREPTHDVPAGRYACLRVTDTGAGIAPAHLARVFEPFFTTKAPGTGTGLGLATVFGIAKQHGGTAMIASEIGRGTTVSVLVPIAATVTAAAAAAPAVVGGVVDGAIAHGNEAILVVEDEVAVGQLVQRVLEMHGYRVAVVGSGVEALARVERAGAAFDLVVTDLVMPGGISGRELAERLRDRLPALAVIFMSGYAGELAGRGLELREGKNFLQKPFTPAALLSSIRGELDRQGELARPRTS